MISVRDLKREFGQVGSVTRALRGVSFEIKKGEFVAIMGPSGSGKSTLLHILSFLDRQSSGSYTFNGRPLHTLDDRELAFLRNHAVGFVFQTFNLLGRTSAVQNVELPLLYASVPRPEREERISQALDAVGLLAKRAQEAGTLSGGEKQRVAIARAIVNRPEVVFADEPTGNLDTKSGEQVMEIFRQLHAGGRTVILVTHDPNIAAYARRLIRMKDGLIESDERRHEASRAIAAQSYAFS